MASAKAPPAPAKKVYITKAGFDRLRAIFHDLLTVQRPRVTHEVQVAAAHGDRSENYEYKLGKRKLREIDSKLHRLQKKIESFEVVDPATRPKTDRAFFGATVTIEDEDGKTQTVQIVGPDELDSELEVGRVKRISYEAPLGRALLGKQEGDTVTVKRPVGDLEIELVKVQWK
ncbi:MAG: GreA/GreB family elongation factor [Deltaproteobacteria bacterium]|nr:GreA/GreB family elongation factor [Deltaproteobacteria bacterium]